MIVGLHGISGSGKDAFASVLVTHGFRRVAFADKLKLAAKIVFDLTDSQLWGADKDKVDANWGVTPAQLLQVFGTECVRDGFKRALPSIGNSVWIRAALMDVVREPGQNYVITDVRYPNEADAIRELGGRVYIVRRPGHVSKRAAHVSETALAGYPFDGMFLNDGLFEAWERKASYFAERCRV